MCHEKEKYPFMMCFIANFSILTPSSSLLHHTGHAHQQEYVERWVPQVFAGWYWGFNLLVYFNGFFRMFKHIWYILWCLTPSTHTCIRWYTHSPSHTHTCILTYIWSRSLENCDSRRWYITHWTNQISPLSIGNSCSSSLHPEHPYHLMSFTRSVLLFPHTHMWHSLLKLNLNLIIILYIYDCRQR